MVPDEITTYEDGEVKLRIDTFYAPLRDRFWISAGVGALEFDEEGLQSLRTVLWEFDQNTSTKEKKIDPYIWKYLFFLELLFFAVLIIVLWRGAL